jgi:hypothetical protein
MSTLPSSFVAVHTGDCDPSNTVAPLGAKIIVSPAFNWEACVNCICRVPGFCVETGLDTLNDELLSPLAVVYPTWDVTCPLLLIVNEYVMEVPAAALLAKFPVHETSKLEPAFDAAPIVIVRLGPE